MDRDAESVYQEALQLSPAERREVVQRLAESLPKDEGSELWLKEVRERKARWEAGLVQGIDGIDGRDVIHDLRKRATING